MRWLLLLLGLVFLGLTAVGVGLGIWSFLGEDDQPELVVDAETKMFPPAPIDHPQEVRFALTNRSNRPVRIVGMSLG